MNLGPASTSLRPIIAGPWKSQQARELNCLLPLNVPQSKSHSNLKGCCRPHSIHPDTGESRLPNRRGETKKARITMEQSPPIIPVLNQPDRCMYTWQECPVPSLWGYSIQRDHCIMTQPLPFYICFFCRSVRTTVSALVNSTKPLFPSSFHAPSSVFTLPASQCLETRDAESINIPILRIRRWRIVEVNGPALSESPSKLHLHEAHQLKPNTHSPPSPSFSVTEP